MNTLMYAAQGPTQPLQKVTLKRRELQPEDVLVDVLYCGICHSDIHTAHGDWGPTPYPCVPGHEIVGTVSAIGSKVAKHKVGDVVGVGCMVNSCRTCAECKIGLEQYCNSPSGPTWTYGCKDPADSTNTLGGYSRQMVVNQDFVLHVPSNADLAKTAPLLCAGITMYSPLKHWGACEGKKVGIIGIGGLGHMGVKLARALGAEVAAITTSEVKRKDAIKYGANHVIVSTNSDDMQKFSGYFDLLINTVPSKHALDQYVNLLKLNGSLVLVGPIATTLEFGASNVLKNRRSVAGSGIGSIKETQEMLDFCVKNNIYPDIELIKADEINDAWGKMVAKAMSHRFVIDIKNTLV